MRFPQHAHSSPQQALESGLVTGRTLRNVVLTETCETKQLCVERNFLQIQKSRNDMYDLLLKNGFVIDGSGRTGYKADVAIENGKIAAVEFSIDPGLAAETVDVTGLAVAPGFIDIHSHSDVAFADDDRSEAKLYQGVTSELVGNCGASPFPVLPEKLEIMAGEAWTRKGSRVAVSLEAFLNEIDRRGEKMGTNLLPLVGHGTLRGGVIGYENRKLSEEEFRRMRQMLAADMKTGAWGLSLGLGYTPGVSADSEELCRIAEEVVPYGGIVTSHMRNQREKTPDSLEEMFAINRHCGAHVHIAHFKASTEICRGKAPEWISILHRAQAEGVNVTADVYPYTAASSDITNSFPKWSLMGGKKRALEALNGAERQRLIRDLEEAFPTMEAAKHLLIVHTCGTHPEADGKTLEEISRLWNKGCVETLMQLTADTKANAECIDFCMAEEDVDYMLSQNDLCIGSDGVCYPFAPEKNAGIPHPRNFGTFPRFLRLAREKKFCSPEMAVRRITGQSADYIGLKDRGYLRKGYAADVTVFDRDKVTDRATYTDPFRKPEGIVHVIMDGKLALRDGVQTAERLGKVLLKK